MQNEDQPPNPADPKPGDPPTGPDRYAFQPPESAPAKIEFKKVRRAADGTSPAGARRKRHVPLLRRWYVLTAAGLVLALVATAGWVGYRGVTAKGHLQTAAGLFVQLQQQIQRADVTGAKGTLAALRVETRAAHEATGGFAWTAASRLPGVGDDLAAVRTVSAVLDDLAENGLPSLLDVASGLDPAKLSPKDGRVDLASLSTAGPRIAGGLAVIRRSRERIDALRTDGLVDQVGAAVTQLSDGLDRAERLVATADRAANLLPAMLGADGPRTYMVLFQNNAEVRATGGMPGAYIVLRADAGAITITDQGTASDDLKVFPVPVQQLSQDMEALYTDRPAVFPADVNLSPDFPTAAGLARAMYQQRKGIAVNGVLAADPVALSYLLRATGAVKVPQGEPLTADNAVRILLSEAYAKYPNPTDQDAYFAGAARAIFEALLRGQGDPQALIGQLATAAGERRLLVWSADPAEAKAFAGTVLQGRLPDDDGAHPTVGVFLNDGGGSKLSYYLTQSAALGVGACQEDGSRELQLALTVGSTAPGAGLPAYVKGLALSGDPHTSRTNVMIFSPTGGGVVGIRQDGKEVQFGAGVERGRGVAVMTVDLPPGTSQKYDITVRTGELPEADAAVTPRLWTTPGVRPWRTAVTAGARCA